MSKVERASNIRCHWAILMIWALVMTHRARWIGLRLVGTSRHGKLPETPIHRRHPTADGARHSTDRRPTQAPMSTAGSHTASPSASWTHELSGKRVLKSSGRAVINIYCRRVRSVGDDQEVQHMEEGYTQLGTVLTDQRPANSEGDGSSSSAASRATPTTAFGSATTLAAETCT